MLRKVYTGQRSDLTVDQVVLGYFILKHFPADRRTWSAWQFYSCEIDYDWVDRLELTWEEAGTGRWSARKSTFHAGRNNWLLWLMRPTAGRASDEYMLLEVFDELIPIPGTYTGREATVAANCELVRFHSSLLSGPSMELDLSALIG